jgi:tryptophanyl-tRNA synthetase
MSESIRKTVLTAAQPTGILTIGNYLGAIKQWTSLLDNNDCLFPLVDMHAITVPYEPADLRQRTRSLVAQYIACGLDPEKSTLFIQSHVVGHAELAWVLGCLTPIGELQRMTQFKDKTTKGTPINAGLLFYPVLMAADILLYNADIVPVGEDQKQHIELARNLAERFNHTYSETFKIPEPQMATTGARILSLQDPTRKMSKSDDNQSSYILLTDTPDDIRRKIARAVTDSGSEIKAGPDKAGITNLLVIMSGFSGKPIENYEAEFAGVGYGEFKKAVGEVVVEGLRPIRERFEEVQEDKSYLDGVLKAGAEAAQKKAYKIMSKVYRKVGFVERFR